MEIIKVVGFAFAAVFIYLLLKDKKSDVAFYVLVVAGILIFMYMIGQLGEVINFIDDIAVRLI